MTKKLDSEYVKNIEEENSRLETENFKSGVEIKKLTEKCDQLQKVNDTFSSCLTTLLEQYSSDKKLSATIMSALNIATKQLLKK
jgi:hypothetical protein